jgi:hypothetical protein
MATIALAAVLPLAAHAQQPERRDIAWYVERPQVLERTLRLCHSDARYANTADCSNAESAASARVAQQWGRQARSGSTSMFDPGYWSENRVARAGILFQCQRRGTGDWTAYPYCQAAAQSRMRELR